MRFLMYVADILSALQSYTFFWEERSNIQKKYNNRTKILYF